MTGGNEGKHKAWTIEIKGLRHIGDLKFAGYIPTYIEYGDGTYADDGGSAGRGGSNKYFTRNQFAIKTGMGVSRLVYGTPAETYGPIGPDNYDILFDWGGFQYSGLTHDLDRALGLSIENRPNRKECHNYQAQLAHMFLPEFHTQGAKHPCLFLSQIGCV